jgi:hypothetical protein
VVNESAVPKRGTERQTIGVMVGINAVFNIAYRA